jgi:hypothetical protein
VVLPVERLEGGEAIALQLAEVSEERVAGNAWDPWVDGHAHPLRDSQRSGVCPLMTGRGSPKIVVGAFVA